MKYNWKKAPSWAQYAATCAFSGNREWFRSEPRSPGWVDVEARPYSAQDGKPLYPGNPWEPALKKLADKTRDDVIGVDHAEEPTPAQLRKELAEREQVPVIYERPIITSGPVRCSDGPTRDRIAAELAEALEAAIDGVGMDQRGVYYSRCMSRVELTKAINALEAYKQSRGE